MIGGIEETSASFEARSAPDHTNGIFSYQLEKKLPNGWEYRLSYQTYFSADMVCYEGKGVPVDIKIAQPEG